MEDRINTRTKGSIEILDILDTELVLEREIKALTTVTREEFKILMVIVLTFVSAYLLCYALKIPYASLTHAKIIYTIFLSANIYAAHIALKAWKKISPTSLSRDMTLMFTISLCGAAIGNTLDTILWFSNYCHFKQNIATNMIFVISILFVLPSIHMLARVCRVWVTKEFLLYFIFFTALIISMPFITNPALIINISKVSNYKEFIFHMLYAFVGGYLTSFSAYIWNKAQGELKYSARYMSLGLGIMSICCAIFAGLISKGNPDQVPSNAIHVTFAISYIFLGFSVTRIQAVLSRALTIEENENAPEIAITEIWGMDSGRKMYLEMEQNIKDTHIKILQAQADTNAHKTIIATLQEEIDKRLEAEKEMLIATQRADLANKAKSQFLAMMSHELKTPLTAIKGYSLLISERGSPIIQEVPTIIQDLGTRIVQNSENLQTIIDSILNYAQLDAGKFICTSNEFPLHMIIDNFKQLVSYQKLNPNCEFILNVKDKETLLYSDIIVIRHIIVNLVINAFKFCKNGKITLGLKVKNKGLVITVEDTGIGLSSKELEHIFAPFYQTSSGNKRIYGGTGLGLALVKRFTEKLEGTIKVTSEVNTFTKFEILIPNIVADNKDSETT